MNPNIRPPTPGTYGVARVGYTRTADDTITIEPSDALPMNLLKHSRMLAEIFPHGVCTVDEFTIQIAQFSHPNVFVEIRIDDRVYGPFGGPWMVSGRNNDVRTSAPIAKRNQTVKMTAFVRGADVPKVNGMEIHLRCLIREDKYAAVTPPTIEDVGPTLPVSELPLEGCDPDD